MLVSFSLSLRLVAFPKPWSCFCVLMSLSLPAALIRGSDVIPVNIGFFRQISQSFLLVTIHHSSMPAVTWAEASGDQEPRTLHLPCGCQGPANSSNHSLLSPRLHVEEPQAWALQGCCLKQCFNLQCQIPPTPFSLPLVNFVGRSGGLALR